jgi:hypothetical protein
MLRAIGGGVALSNHFRSPPPPQAQRLSPDLFVLLLLLEIVQVRSGKWMKKLILSWAAH